MDAPLWKIQVLLFAGARQVTGLDTIEITVENHADAAAVMRAIVNRFPELTELASISRLSMNCCYLSPQDAIEPSAEFALIPPVSGG